MRVSAPGSRSVLRQASPSSLPGTTPPPQRHPPPSAPPKATETKSSPRSPSASSEPATVRGTLEIFNSFDPPDSLMGWVQLLSRFPGAKGTERLRNLPKVP